MPGIFGGVGCSSTLYEALRREFSSPWTDCECVHLAGGILGGHAFGSSMAVYATDTDLHFAVDGEASLYRKAHAFIQRGEPTLFQMSSGKLELTSACKGNVAAVDTASRTWYLAAEWTGTFPLYYTDRSDAFVFSSRLRPLARVMGAAYDPIGITEFLLKGYILAGRTHYRGIRRLLPGQVVTYEPDHQRLRVCETSSLWVGAESYGPDDTRFASEAAWGALRNAIWECLEAEGKHGLMLSAGWDSRLLLLAMLKRLGSDALLAYSHGDLRSRELRITEAICQLLRIEWRRESLDDAMFDLDLLQRAFDRTENVLFPHWYRAGLLLEKAGVKCISAGVYGEVLGGHYGPPMLLRGRKKITSVAAAMLGRPSLTRGSKDLLRNIYELLCHREIKKPRALTETFWKTLSPGTEAINADIATTLRRLEKRGITNEDQLVEAFISENRGTQYINAQILSCRASVDIVIPFGDRDLLILASRIPFTTKVYNSLNRNILRGYAPDLLRFSSAATLVPTAMPIFIQETSRACRWIIDKGFWKLYFATHGRIGPPHMSWVNFEFLRNGKALRPLIDDLRSDIWSKRDLDLSISNAARFSRHSRIFPEFFLKVYATDLMLR
jgi:Asparagine synthase